jgi:small Trp-rich protein
LNGEQSDFSGRAAADTVCYSFLPGFIEPLPERVMWFLIAGVGLLLLKYLEVGFVAEWSWWVVLSPFALAVLWWAWADATGYTKRKAMEKMDERKQERIDKQKEAMGMRPRKPR